MNTNVIITERRSDAELDTYFGGRAAYLASCRKSLEEAKNRKYNGEDTLSSFFGKSGQEDFDEHQAYIVAQYEAAIAANS